MATNKVQRWMKTLRVQGRPDEYETKKLLSDFGIPVPQGVRFAPGEPIREINLKPPFAVKVCSPEILHKTDEGGVILNVTPEALGSAASGIRSRFPDAPLLVERQIRFTGIEMIVGALNDPSFGPAVMAGAGGVLTELYRDVAFRLAPCSEAEAERMIQELMLAPVFSGFRGMDLDAQGLAGLIASAAALGAHLGGILDQLDLNPVVFSAGKWIALDGKLVLRL